MTDYDLLVVGAGMAGLRVGIEALRQHPSLRCCILEKYNYTGGRVVTYHTSLQGRKGILQWENGAGRISTRHKRVLSLFRRYGLHFIPISHSMDWEQVGHTNPFDSLSPIYLDPLRRLPPSLLSKYTLSSLLSRVIGPSRSKRFLSLFPYHSESYTLRADEALRVFQHEMGPRESFGVCAEGLQTLAHSMRDEFLQKGGTLLQDHEVVSLHREGSFVRVKGDSWELVGKACVLAVHVNALRHIKGLPSLPFLHHLAMRPLVRMYAVFPVRQGQSWFSGMNKLVTASPLRYIIPIDATKGVIMISYTDGADADYWRTMDRSLVQENVMKEVRALFPDRTIPDPLFFKVHAWKDGCTYWLPGSYSVEDMSHASLHPSPSSWPSLFLCGESFSPRPCWIESALEQADALLHLPAFRHRMESKSV